MTESTAAHPGGGAGRTVPRMNVLAVVTLAVALYLPLAGIICGHLALGQIRARGEDGEGIAKAGLLISYILFGLGVIAFFVFAGIALSFLTLTAVVR